MERTEADTPPLQSSDEATQEQLQLAIEQGDAYQKALDSMVSKEAHGSEMRAGEYLVGYAVEEAEGMYHWMDGKLHWQDPQDENVHIEITVRDGADGRFIPGLNVIVTVIDDKGRAIGIYQQPFLWHPWLFHYGRNWKIPRDGIYTLRVHIEPPDFMRHDKKNGLRFREPVEVEFSNVKLETGQKIS